VSRIARIGLETELQLRQRLHPVGLLAAREVELRGDARLREVRLVVEQALEDLQRVVAAPQLEQLRGGGAELLDRRVHVLDARERLGEAQVGQGIGGIELDDLPEDVDRLAVALLALQACRDLVEGGERVARQAEAADRARRASA